MITERAMLAAVHISIWTAVKHDRKISRDVASQHGAHQGAGRYNKQLLRGADKLDELRTLAGQVRQYFYQITLPWSDEGFRLLPSDRRALAGTTSNSCAEPTNWMNCALWRARCGNTSTKSRCRGPMRDSACCHRTSTLI